jgi:adenosylhomocysteine nucleosidase
MMPNPIAFACNTALVKLAQNVSAGLVLDKVGGRSPQIITGTIVTGDVFVASNTATQQLWLKMHAEATEMEGASVSQACWQQQVPFLVIRSLSDNASNSASADVATFYKTAAHNSATLVMAIVKEIK